MIKKLKAWLDKPEIKMKYKKSRLYAKSLEEGETMHTSTLVDGEKVLCQTIEDMIETKTIQPNTLSFNLPQRLSASTINYYQTGTYRPSGILFTTFDNPDFTVPFDLVVLTKYRNLEIDHSDLYKDVKEQYANELIEGWEGFAFENLKQMPLALFKQELALKAVNEFRITKGYFPITDHKKRLVDYNETVFTQAPLIAPLGVYGTSDLAKKKAKELGLKYYKTADHAFAELTSVAGCDRRTWDAVYRRRPSLNELIEQEQMRK